MKNITPLIDSYAERKRKLVLKNLNDQQLLKEKIKNSTAFLHKLRLQIRNKGFQSEADEIHFFKHVKPKICGEIKAYTCQLSFFVEKPNASVCVQRDYIKLIAMKTKPQTIQIFLPDGSPTSIREAEITNRLVKAILFPRNKIQEVSKREMVHFTGVYFLFGNTVDGSKPLVYIGEGEGEGEDCFKRIQSHNRKKDFWSHCIIVTTKTDEFTKTDGKFLEHYCLNKAKEFGRYTTDNDTGSKKPSLPESREYDLLDNFETLKILLATLGYPLFESKRKTNTTKETFFCKGKKALAMGEMTDEGFVVYKEGICNLKESQSAGKWVADRRNILIEEGVLKVENDVLVFQSDYIFDSVSAAAATILARRANGWIEWKDKNGKTLDALKRK